MTINTPKPLIPLVNRPFLDHILYLLRAHGITDVVLAMSYLSESFEEAYGDGSHLGMKVTYVQEVEPLGTAGAIKNVESYLTPGETFLVFNGDVLTDLDLTDMLRFHRDNGSVCTISLTPVEDPSAYGVVDMDPKGRIQRFTEKPKREEATSNWVNAGTYVLEPEVLAYVPEGEHYMVERGLFPTLLKEGYPLYGYRANAYWMDIGTPAKYVEAQADLLAGRLSDSLQPEGTQLAEHVWAGPGTVISGQATVRGPVVLGAGCSVGAGATITGPVVLGDNCRVDEGAYLEGVIAWQGATFEKNSHCWHCMVGTGARVGAESQVSSSAIIGDGASTGAGNQLAAGVKLWPGISLPDHALTF